MTDSPKSDKPVPSCSGQHVGWPECLLADLGWLDNDQVKSVATVYFRCSTLLSKAE